MAANSVETIYSLALKAAYKILSWRAYSEQEIREKLKVKGYDGDTINKVINYLTGQNYLNDSKLCDDLFEKLFQSGKHGYRLINDKLRARKLPPALIAAKMKKFDFEAEAEQAADLAKKRCGYKEKNRTIILRISRYLTARGYSAASVTKAIKELEGQE